jgi:pimeloyl-ACP methyl ester carboxylesterase
MREYTPQLFADAIREFLKTQVKKSADVVALSLSCEFAALAATEEPELFHKLVFISPSGLGRRGRSASPMANPGFSGQRIYGLLSAPLWGRALYDLIATRASIRYFLSRSFVGPVPEDLVDYDYATSHQPGAENVPLNFISGKLFTPGIMITCYALLKTPTCIIYDRDAFVGFESMPGLLENNPQFSAVQVTPTLGLPHFEQPNQTIAALDEFFA